MQTCPVGGASAAGDDLPEKADTESEGAVPSAEGRTQFFSSETLVRYGSVWSAGFGRMKSVRKMEMERIQVCSISHHSL